MYTSINRIIGVTLKLMCAIAVIFTLFTVETSAASASKKRKAKTTKVKNVKKRHKKVKEDNRVVAAKDEDRSSDDITLEIINDEQLGSDEILTTAAHMPSFPGGDAGLMEFLRYNIRYPQAAADNNIQGKVIVQFVVTKTGKVGEVKVVRSVDPNLDREAVRVCKALPDFSPGRNTKGEPVNVWYTLPITFKLSSTDMEE